MLSIGLPFGAIRVAGSAEPDPIAAMTADVGLPSPEVRARPTDRPMFKRALIDAQGDRCSIADSVLRVEQSSYVAVPTVSRRWEVRQFR